jgi:hypothetical protein
MTSRIIAFVCIIAAAVAITLAIRTAQQQKDATP